MLTHQTEAMPVTVQPSAPRDSAGVGPFRTLERFADEVARIADDFGLVGGPRREAIPNDMMVWAPQIDLIRHQDELVIRADLPGVEKDNIKVSVTEDAVTIRGERHRALEEERAGVYRSERSYGGFHRTIALPQGTPTDQVKASFKNGVLEVRMPAAPGTQGRPVEITE
jgi:HSP20 family protein